MSDSDPPLYKPTPRRRFILGDSFDPSPADTPPATATTSSESLEPPQSGLSKRSQSIKNLTASALFGIYGPSAYDSVPGTPGATRQSSTVNLLNGALNGSIPSPTSPVRNDFSGSDGSSLPSRRSRPLSNLTRPSRRRLRDATPLQQITRCTLLFLSGASYGLIISHLHDQSRIVPVKVPVERDTPGYLAFWGVVAVVLGSLLPWADGIWEEYVWESGGDADATTTVTDGDAIIENIPIETEEREVTPVWNPAVRSIGAFVGIAYAIRKLPWQSTSQASLTLAFVNPVLWYLLDRTRTGFWLSSFVAIFGSMFLIGINPDFVAIPSDDGVGVVEKLRMAAAAGHGLQMQVVGATTWIASVLYVSCLCFGNLGRRLSGRVKGDL
ncbi:hypothetical protein Dda_5559 [Drechslerella dactyloides]|uniref:Uncharacterized protein n=1 Tax=Drechslerella dactyloides TaxID=74499 RepID=A0AAD6NIZ7_DREDA|nr:hypothetical protein Dda_5559 [Drechslerella dactyloides]